MKTNTHFWSYIIQFFLEWRMFQTHLEKIKTYIWCSITCFKNRAVYEITWKNILELNRLQITIWLMHIACWIPKGTNTDSECVLLFASPLQRWLHECASLLHHTYIASCPPPSPISCISAIPTTITTTTKYYTSVVWNSVLLMPNKFNTFR